MMETELSRITWDDLIILDCLIPVSSVKKWLPQIPLILVLVPELIPNLQSATQVFVKMLKDGVFWIVGVLNAEIHRIIHLKLPFSPWESFQVFFFLEFWFFGLGCFFVSFWAKKMRDLNVDLFGLGCFFCQFLGKRWEICWWYLGLSRFVIWWQQGGLFANLFSSF